MIAMSMKSTTQQDAADAPAAEYFPTDRPWEEQSGVHHLIGMRCSACGTLAFPKREVCSGCGADSGLEPARLSARGKLYTYTEVHAAPAGFNTPYVIGYVDLDDGVRVFGQIDAAMSDLALDQTVETTIGVVRRRTNGTPVIGYKFRSVQP